MQTQKTTSFSKILANKNSSNNPAQQVLTTQQEAINSSPNPFFIDQTKANFLLNNYQKNLGDKNPRLNESESRIDELDEEEEAGHENDDDDDFDDQGLDEELDNSNLEFSDHAGVYEVLNQYQDFDFQIKNIGKYDIGRLKRNYKLTFGKNSKMMHENNEDSLVFSSLNPTQKFNFDDYVNTGHESYEDDLYDEEDNEDHTNESIDPSNSYLEQISKDILFLNNTGNEDQLMDENILNWSMKLSSHDQFRMRSRSRSPKSGKQWKSFASSQNRMLSTQFQNFNQLKNFQQLKLEQEQFQSQQHNKKSLSTTSWGKLKNSKSNSSNIGLSNQSIANSNEESHFSNFNNENSTYGSKSINSSHHAYTLPSNPHLYKVYQNSKSNLNSSNLDETTTSTSGSDLSFQLQNKRQSRAVPQESAKKISFSQLKQRSLSSCAIAVNSQSVDNSAMKKSIGIQHEANIVERQKNDSSPTILCMVLDKSGKINKKELLMAAAKAKAMADQAGVLKIQRPKIPTGSKRSSSLFSTKHSLPDLTFLTHYSDKKPEPSFSTPITKPSPQNPQSAPSDLLKRKTLKSIKRYRQTKQNTEPCAVQVAEPVVNLNFEENIEYKFERRTSLPFNKRGKNPLNPSNNKQPLKSCLKRRESHLKHSQSLQNNFNQGEKALTKSTLMFVPLVGYLFSCDTDSSTRYMYYNNLEKNRLSKMYKLLTGEFCEYDEENTEEDEIKIVKNKLPEITKSDNDLRIKKAVKFKPIKPREPAHMPKPAPLLQYDTLIAMLKSSKEKKPRIASGLDLKNSNTIEADSISMASLSESPPSEFKFSDDEENLIVKTNSNQLNKIEHVKILKKNFHTILLKDQKLNNLKEILLELKTHQEKQTKFDPTHCSSTTSSASFSANSSSTSTCSSITSPLNTSLETKESIEKLAGYLFDFLKQNLKPPSPDCLLPTSNIFKSTIDSPLLNLKKPNQLTESNTLTQTFSQYTQLWNLIECTMNANLELQRQPVKTTESPISKCWFFLPKEAYLTMFQEINKFASSTNQTYLIDNSINTSQLRRKHHFMVMLMSLKFKFQLFVIYLLNHKQLANWFEHVNRDKSLLKNFYEFKLLAVNKGLGNNSSGDSGMGTEFMQVSSASSTSSSLSISNNFQSPNTTVNEANFNVKNLSNISVFENEEYFSYFHKLLLQFNQLDLKLQTHSNEVNPNRPQTSQTPPVQEKICPTPQFQAQKPPIIQTPIINRPKQHDSRHLNNRNHIPKPVIGNLNSNIPKSSSNVYHTGSSQNTSGGHHSHSGFNLKNISKRFNIKSWFTSSNSSTNIPTSASHNNFTTQNLNSTGSRLPFGLKTLTPSNRNEQKNFRENVKKKLSRESNTTKCCDVNTTGVLGSGVGALCNNSNSFMKHSLSEPSLNAILDR